LELVKGMISTVSVSSFVDQDKSSNTIRQCQRKSRKGQGTRVIKNKNKTL
jgi:hypothetical protein